MNKEVMTDNLLESERELVQLREQTTYLEAEIAIIINWGSWKKEQEATFQATNAALSRGLRERIFRNILECILIDERPSVEKIALFL